MRVFTERLIEIAPALGMETTPGPDGGLRIRQLSSSSTVLVWGTRSSLDSPAGVAVCRSKLLSEQVLREMGIPTTTSRVVWEPLEAIEQQKEDPRRLVLKPDRGYRGEGVSLRVDSPVAAARAFLHASNARAGEVLVQEFVPGRAYRVQVLRGRILFTIERRPRGDAPGNLAAGAARVEVKEPIGAAVTEACLAIAERLQMHCLGVDIISPEITGEVFTVLEVNEGPELLPRRARPFLQSLFA